MSNSLPKPAPILPVEYYEADKLELPSSGYYEVEGGNIPLELKEAAVARAGSRRPTRKLPEHPAGGMSDEEIARRAKVMADRKKRYKKNEEKRKRLEKKWSAFVARWDWLTIDESYVWYYTTARCKACGRGVNLSKSSRRYSSRREFLMAMCTQEVYDQIILHAHKHKNCTREHWRTEEQRVVQYKSPEQETTRRERLVRQAIKESGIDADRIYANGTNGRVMCRGCNEWDRFPDDGKDYLGWLRRFQKSHEECVEDG